MFLGYCALMCLQAAPVALHNIKYMAMRCVKIFIRFADECITRHARSNERDEKKNE